MCEKEENRLIAENILDLLIRHLQEYCQVILQPSEVRQTRKTSVVTKRGSMVLFYPTALRRVQRTPKTSTNITQYLYSRGLVRLVCVLLTNQLARFPAPIPFHLPYFCHTLPVNKDLHLHQHNLECWIISLLLDFLLCSIA